MRARAIAGFVLAALLLLSCAEGRRVALVNANPDNVLRSVRLGADETYVRRFLGEPDRTGLGGTWTDPRPDDPEYWYYYTPEGTYRFEFTGGVLTDVVYTHYAVDRRYSGRLDGTPYSFTHSVRGTTPLWRRSAAELQGRDG